MKHKKWQFLVFALSMILVLTGCAAKKSTKKEPFFEKWKAMAEKSKAYSPPERRRAMDLPEKTMEVAPEEEELKVEIEKLLPTQKVTMRMRNTDVNVILRALARTTGQNIMLNEGVKGITNIDVIETPWDQVFLGILRTRGLSYTWEGDIIRIMTLEDMKHDGEIEKTQQERKKQKLELEKVEPLLEPLLTRIIKVDYMDAKGLAVNLEKLLTSKGEGKGENGQATQGSVAVDEHNNALIIHAIRNDISKMINLIEMLDRPTPQILIEANIIETTRDTARELGIQWGGLYHSGNHWITPGANATGLLGNQMTAADGTSQGINPTSGTAANFPATFGTEGAGLTLGFAAERIGKSILNIQLSALEKEGKLHILSSPSITTLDNQPAIIESGAEVPFQTIDADGSIETEWKKAVLRLEVIPHVIDKKLLKMNIITNKDELDFTRTVQGNPTIITKKAETNVILLDGQTTVIGGLTKETTSGAESGTPGLKDIPILGWLFKSDSKASTMEEVLIFITPYVLKEKGEDKEQEPEKK